MIFDDFAKAQSFFLWATFAIAFVMGAVANKTNFCTMGAVSDWVNMGDTGRMRAWLLAIAVAVLGMILLESKGLVNADATFPPYRANQLIWAENLLGGILFGIGMTLASGCGNKTLVRIGGGNIKSIMVLAIVGLIAYYMVNPFPNTDKTLFTVLFYDWLRPLAANLSTHQDLGAVISGSEHAMQTRLVVGGLLALGIIAFVFKSAEFRSSFDNIFGGVIIGLAVLAAWYVTSNVAVTVDGEQHTLQDYVQQWDFLASSPDGKPEDSRSLASQSFTFINPMGQTFGYIKSGFDHGILTFGVMAVGGVIVGSLVWALLSRRFRIEWFASWKDFSTHLIGAVLMGFGGVLAMGCTIGQAITGVSTLAIGSFVAFFGIVLGSALTMKVQYYKMVYEDDATFFKALVTGLVDLRLLPKKLRQLDEV